MLYAHLVYKIYDDAAVWDSQGVVQGLYTH